MILPHYDDDDDDDYYYYYYYCYFLLLLLLLFLNNHNISRMVCVRTAWYVDRVVNACGLQNQIGYHLWTAGQWEDPRHQSPFVWKVNIRNSTSYDKYPMNYTNFARRQPDNAGGVEGCIEMSTDEKYRWNDMSCSRNICSICEMKHD